LAPVASLSTDGAHGTGRTLSLSLSCLLGNSEEAHNSKSQPGGACTSLNMAGAYCLAKAYVTAGVAASPGELGQVPGPVAHKECTSPSLAFPHVCVPQDQSSKDTKYVPWISDNSQQQSTDLNTGYLIPIVGSVEWIKRLCDIPSITDIQLRIKIPANEDSSPETILRIIQDSQGLCAASNVRVWMNKYWL
jgi:hypothetical protein